MDEEKNSFLLYNDLIHVVKKLEKEERGELFMMILSYANGEDPKTGSKILELVFEPVKQNMDRNKIKWKQTKNVRSESGYKGGIKSGESRRRKQSEANEASASKVKQTKQSEANEAVNVSVNVNDTVNVTVPVNENGKEQITPPTPSPGENIFLLEFNLFRTAYPGDKRGNQTEFDNFKKKHRDWREALPKLLPALKTQITARAEIERQGGFLAPWKMLSTFINTRWWETEINTIVVQPVKTAKKKDAFEVLIEREKQK